MGVKMKWIDRINRAIKSGVFTQGDRDLAEYLYWSPVGEMLGLEEGSFDQDKCISAYGEDGWKTLVNLSFSFKEKVDKNEPQVAAQIHDLIRQEVNQIFS